MGYSSSGSFGMPMGGRGAPGSRGGPGGRVGAPGPTDAQAPRPQPGVGAARDGQPRPGMFMGMRGGPGGTKETDPAKIA